MCAIARSIEAVTVLQAEMEYLNAVDALSRHCSLETFCLPIYRS